MTDQPPIHLPNYTILGLAGAGAMGTVYRAEQTSPSRPVALKVLSGRRTDPASLAAFRREASLIAQLEHPHIVPMYDFGEQDGLPYLVLRYLDGGTLADRLGRGPVDLPTAVRVLRSVAQALDFAHKRGIVHKDIKPSNILLDKVGNAYLSDFGIAGAVSDARSGAPTGSAAYMSPEQGRGDRVDARADIYALGVVLFEALTGQKPYSAETALGVIVRHMHDPIPSARALRPTVPTAADELIGWAMAKDPSDRVQTAGEFARLLDQILAHPDDRLRRPRPAAETRSRKVNPIVWIAPGVLGVACLIAVALFGGNRLAAALFPARTAIPTASEQPTAIAASFPTSTPEGQLLGDDFSDPSNGFSVRQDSDGGVEYVNGMLRVTVLNQGVEWFSLSRRVKAQDVIIDVDVRQETGEVSSEYGVVCRWADPGSYIVAAISDQAMYSVWAKRDGNLVRLIDWTPAAALSGDVNALHHIRLTCSGDQLAFAVDGELLGETVDPSPGVGDVAVLAGLRGTGELSVTFDNVQVSTP